MSNKARKRPRHRHSLLFVHVFALAFYCAFAGVASARVARGAASHDASPRSFAAAVAAIPRSAFRRWRLTPVRTSAVRAMHCGSLVSQGLRAADADRHQALWLDLLLAAAILAPLVWALCLGRLEAHAGLLLAVCGLVVLALATPTAVAGTWWIDNRFPVMAMLALMAGTRPHSSLPATGRALLAAALAGVVMVRTGWISYVWHERQADAASCAGLCKTCRPAPPSCRLDNVLSPAEARFIPIGRYFHNGHLDPLEPAQSLPSCGDRRSCPTCSGRQARAAARSPPWDQISLEDGLLPWDALLQPDTTPAHFVTGASATNMPCSSTPTSAPASIDRIPRARAGKRRGLRAPLHSFAPAIDEPVKLDPRVPAAGPQLIWEFRPWLLSLQAS
jgi:hypothetical protein